MDLGSPVPSFSLTNIEGSPVDLEPAPAGSSLILYFFDADKEAADVFAGLNEVAAKSGGSLSLLGITRTNQQETRDFLEGRVSLSNVLIDNRGVTHSLGLSRTLPAAVIAGAGNIVVSVMAPADSGPEILDASTDTLISAGFPASAINIYNASPSEWLDETKKALATGFALAMTQNSQEARRALDSVAGTASPLASEARAGLAFLFFQQGKDSMSLAQCNKASGNSFAQYVAAMVKTRAGECSAASKLFNRAAGGDFVFKWQKALALNMAARIAEENGDQQGALSQYKRAFQLAPLSPTINANLLTYHWRRGNIPGAAAYAEIVRSAPAADTIIRALVDEFESETEFVKNPAARKALEKELNAGAGKTADSGERPDMIIVSDFAVSDCTPELNCLSIAAAGLLRQSLESGGGFVAVRRCVMREAAKKLQIQPEKLQDPVRLKEIADAVSADLMAFAEVGAYEGRYFLNLRIAKVETGEVIAVASERFDSFDELAPAIQRSAAAVMRKISSK